MWRWLVALVCATAVLTSCSPSEAGTGQTAAPSAVVVTQQDAAVVAADSVTAALLQQVLVAAGFDDIGGDIAPGHVATLAAGWDGTRYEVTLIDPKSSYLPPPNGESMRCGFFTYQFDGSIPDSARQAIRDAAGCDGPTLNLALTVRYEECVRQAGLVPVEAQVFLDSSGAPLHIKTAPEVPAGIHGPCWEAIGGEPTNLSSYGSP